MTTVAWDGKVLCADMLVSTKRDRESSDEPDGYPTKKGYYTANKIYLSNGTYKHDGDIVIAYSLSGHKVGMDIFNKAIQLNIPLKDALNIQECVARLNIEYIIIGEQYIHTVAIVNGDITSTTFIKQDDHVLAIGAGVALATLLMTKGEITARDAIIITGSVCKLTSSNHTYVDCTQKPYRVKSVKLTDEQVAKTLSKLTVKLKK